MSSFWFYFRDDNIVDLDGTIVSECSVIILQSSGQISEVRAVESSDTSIGSRLFGGLVSRKSRWILRGGKI